MFNRVILNSLRYRSLVMIGAAVTLAAGGYFAATTPIDIFPDLDRPRVVLMAECPGLAAEEVESLVTHPIETALLGAAGVEAVRSQSTASLAIIYVEFDWSVDPRVARQTVQERLATVESKLPPDVRPEMTPTSSIMGQILHVGITAPNGGVTPMELGTLAHWVVRPRLLRIPGIAEVIVMGGERKQYQVLINPEALLEYGVNLRDVEGAVKAGNLNATGGFDIQGESERPIRVVGRLGPEPAKVLEDLRRLPIKTTRHRTILLEQVARVLEGPELKRGDGGVNGVAGVVVTIVKQPHVDTRALTDAVNIALSEIEPTLPKGVLVNRELFQLKRFINLGIYNVGEALVLGAVLVLVVLTIFLQNLRTTFISLTAIPLSLAVTAVVFRIVSVLTGTHLSINVMTLGGIAVAMGELVDDAIVDVENIHRRLRENAARPQPLPALRVVYEASKEIRSAIVFGTAVVILVFLPLFALSGVEGRLFAPLGVAYITAILASLVVSLTVTPVLSYYLLAGGRSASHVHADGLVVRFLKTLARPLVQFSMAFPAPLLIGAWIVFGLAVWQATKLGANFLPPFDEGSIQVNVSLPPGSSLEASNRACAIIDQRLAPMRAEEDDPNRLILHFLRRTGRAERDEHAQPVTNTEYILSMNPRSGVSREEALRTVLADLRAALPGVDIEGEQPLAHLISHMLSGVYAQIGVKVFGDDLDQLQRIAEQVKAAAKEVRGLTPAVVEAQQMSEEVEIRLRSDDLAFHGFSREQVATVVQTALQGEVVSTVIEGQRRFDLLVRLDDSFRTDLPKLGKLRLDRPDGKGQVLLEEIADIGDGLGPNAVNRENVRRRLVIRINTEKRDLASAVTELKQRVAEHVSLPQGYFIEFGGQFESQQRAMMVIIGLALLALVGMFGVLMILFPSTRVVLQILNAVPTAFIGGVLALALTKQSLSVASLVGFISLGGIAVRNGILLVSHYLHLMREEGDAFAKEMIVRGSLERLSPVLMTALTAGIALVPLVLEGQKPGREILYPVATVILGGLATSTFCEFLIHPGLFWRFSGRDADKLIHVGEEDGLPEKAE
jgi:CzcA family heavy metal efflux pump